MSKLGLEVIENMIQSFISIKESLAGVGSVANAVSETSVEAIKDNFDKGDCENYIEAFIDNQYQVLDGISNGIRLVDDSINILKELLENCENENKRND